MPRAIVTPSLAETIRNIRLQNKIQAKQLAAHINKSAAYISKLENGKIQTVDTDELYSILQFISREESFIDLAEQIYKSLKLKYSAKEIDDQLWFVNFETVECLLPLPDSLINELNSRVEQLGITRHYLVTRINANEALTEEDKNNNAIPFNQWYQSRENGDSQSIKIMLPEDRLNDLLDKKYDVAPYIFVFCILFYLLKIEKYNETIHISSDSNVDLQNETTAILNSFKFFSISEKDRLISEMHSQEEINSALSSFDRENITIVNSIISGFQFASEQNIKSTNKQLKAFEANMRWDLGFMLRLISLNYSELQKTSISNRRNLLNEINELINKYRGFSEDQNRMESY